MKQTLKTLPDQHSSVQRMLSNMMLARTRRKEWISIHEDGMTDQMKDYLTRHDYDYSYDPDLAEFEIKIVD